MKKAFIFGLLVFILSTPIVKAENKNAKVVGTDILVSSAINLEKPNNSCSYQDQNGNYSSIYASRNLRCLDTGDEIVIYNYDKIEPSSISSCKKGYYYISYTWPTTKNTYKGYICADNVVVDVDTKSYEEEFKSANIPEIYWDKLSLLKQAHPNWKFTVYNTNLDWDTVITKELGANYIQSTNPIYLAIGEGYYDLATNSYIMKEKGGWYAANKATIAYYMDPRNFLDEKNVFMFENLGYNNTYQTLQSVESILKNTDLLPYASKFLEAATYDGNKVSPIMLSALSRQEVVIAGGKLSNSANGTEYLDKGKYYNFYNWGAYSSCTLDNGQVGYTIQCGLMYAYHNGWNTPELSILKGAQNIARSYINVGQNTLYFKKFNVTSNNTYSHQYQTNVEAPIAEARTTYDAYQAIEGLLNSEIEFIIPVYKNMPASTASLPTGVDEKEIEEYKETIINEDISNVISTSGYKIVGQYLMDVKIKTTAKEMLAKLGNNATIDRDGKNISNNEFLGTADILKIGDYTYRIIINGDINGDGEITPADYVKIKNYIMNSSGLTGSFKQAADVNGDSKITPADYVNVKNYIMGASSTLR